MQIEVADNGPGIPAEIAERIFEPFFTTKPQGVGTGIGLSVSQGIIAAHGGEIAVASRPEGGALFTITLPATSAGAQSDGRRSGGRADRRPRPGGRGRGRDRADGGRGPASRSSSGGGGDERPRGAGAARAHPVDLILSDLRMPDLDGPGLHRELAASSPELARRMVFVTGDVLTPETATFLARTSLPVIEKPIDPYDLRLGRCRPTWRRWARSRRRSARREAAGGPAAGQKRLDLGDQTSPDRAASRAPVPRSR